MERVMLMASKHPVMIFSMSSCCMCHVVKSLMVELGAKPAVHELDKDPEGKEMEMALIKLLGRSPSVPAVFIGGQLVGLTDKVMSLHLGGSLVPMLTSSGAISN